MGMPHVQFSVVNEPGVQTVNNAEWSAAKITFLEILQKKLRDD